MTLDLDAIEQSARAATPGPWEHVAFRHMQHDVFTPEDDRPLAEGAGTIHCWHAADARHIATADPSTVLALVALVRELEAALGEACDIADYERTNCEGQDYSDERAERIAALRSKVQPPQPTTTVPWPTFSDDDVGVMDAPTGARVVKPKLPR